MHLSSRPLVVLFAFLVTGTAGFADVPVSPVPPHVTLRVATVQVRVVPDHRDWTYEVGEPARFHIAVIADSHAVDNATVSYQVGPELMPVETKTAVVPLEGLVVEAGTMTQPGFVRCNVTAEVAGRTYRGAGTAAFSPEKIKPTQTDPADFDEFWKAQKAELAKVPVEPQLTLLPDQCTDTVNVYHVSFRNVGPNWTAVPSRMYGIYSEPKTPGKYPALLFVPGAGVRPYAGQKGWAVRGAITLEIGVHGIPVNMPQSVYDALHAGALAEYPTYNLDDREKFYYRRIYLGCVRANDFLTGREMWNGRDLVVLGASQGGQLAIATAALDPRVTALSATHPAFCDVSGPLHNRAGGWPHPFKRYPPANNPSIHETPAKIATVTYYDTVNFARRLKVPGFYIWGYNDEVCPPTSTYSAYNVITAPKQLAVEFEQAHTYPAEQSAAVDAWVRQQLGL